MGGEEGQVPQVGISVDNLTRCSRPLLDSLYVNFCNISGISTNFLFVEPHLLHTYRHLLFLTETQVSIATNSKSFSFCFLNPEFKSKDDCCMYICMK